MLRELASFFRSDNPLRDMGERFAQMLQIAQALTIKAGDIFFSGTSTPEDRQWIFEQDRKVNKLEREIRKRVVAHLSVPGNTWDLPYCLLLMSVVKDVERIGDYSKNLAEINDFYKAPLPAGEIQSGLLEIRADVEEAFGQLARVFEESDQEAALALVQRGKASAQRCNALIRTIAESDHDAGTATALTLGTRYYKRVGGHVLNVLSSVVMPLHKIDYYDEDALPPHLKKKP